MARLLEELCQLGDPAQTGGRLVTIREGVQRLAQRLPSELTGGGVAVAGLQATIVDLLRRTGDAAQAVALGRAATAAVEHSVGSESAAAATVWSSLGKAQLDYGQETAARRSLRRALVLRERLFAADDRRVCASLADLYECQVRTFEYYAAEDLFPRAERALKQAGAQARETFLQLLSVRAEHLLGWQRTREALAVVAEAERLLGAEVGSGSPRRLDLDWLRFSVLARRGELPAAEARMEEVIDRATALHGTTSHPTVLRWREELADFLRSVGRHDAEVAQRRALVNDIRAVCAPDSRPVADAVLGLGKALRDGGRFGEAETMLAEALSRFVASDRREAERGREAGWGEAQVLAEQGRLAARRGEPDKAVASLSAATAILARLTTDTSPLRGSLASEIAVQERRRGRLAEAEKMARKALGLCERIVGSEDRGFVRAADVLMTLLREQGRRAELAGLHEQWVASLRRKARAYLDERPAEYPRALAQLAQHRTHSVLGCLLTAAGRFDEADAVLRDAIRGLEREAGLGHAMTRQACAWMEELQAARRAPR